MQPSPVLATEDVCRCGIAAHAPLRVFVSYSHRDQRLQSQLLTFLAGLTENGFQFWTDKDISTGQKWDAQIRQEITRCDIALVLVSQDFLNSTYCRNVEVKQFIARQKSEGLIVYPVILSACSWGDQEWLASTQYQPRGGQTIEEHFRQRGKRMRLFLKIHDELAEIGDGLRSRVIDEGP